MGSVSTCNTIKRIQMPTVTGPGITPGATGIQNSHHTTAGSQRKGHFQIHNFPVKTFYLKHRVPTFTFYFVFNPFHRNVREVQYGSGANKLAKPSTTDHLVLSIQLCACVFNCSVCFFS